MLIDISDEDIEYLKGLNFINDGFQNLLLCRLSSSVKEAISDKAAGNVYLVAAQENYAQEGSLEFDDNAVVSISEDGGAYVMGWLWIDDKEAGVDREKE